jgi:hypothetical protein
VRVAFEGGRTVEHRLGPEACLAVAFTA